MIGCLPTQAIAFEWKPDLREINVRDFIEQPRLLLLLLLLLRLNAT